MTPIDRVIELIIPMNKSDRNNTSTDRVKERIDCRLALKKAFEEGKVCVPEDFCKWLEEHGYLDSDWWCEQPSVIKRYSANLAGSK